MQGDRDGDSTLSPQGGHGLLCLCLIAGGFDPGAAQVGQLVELDTVFLQNCWTRWCWNWFCGQTTEELNISWIFTSCSLTSLQQTELNEFTTNTEFKRREEQTRTQRRTSKDKQKVRKNRTGSCRVFSVMNFDRVLSHFANRKYNNESCSWTLTADLC